MDFIFDPSLVLYLPLHELDGASFASRDAYRHLCTVAGALWTPHGRSFDGADDDITIPDVVGIQNIFDGGGTLEGWINPASDGEDNQGFIAYKGWNLNNREESGGKVKLRFECMFSGANGDWATGLEVIIGSPSHIAVTYDNGNVNNVAKIYVNGLEVTIATANQPTGTRSTDVGANLIIGNYASAIRTFDGFIGEVRIYSRALTPQEIQHNYLATKWRYR